MRHQFGWDYPPGVTGREPQITGYSPPCECGHEYDDHVDTEITYGDDDYGYDSFGSMVCTIEGCKCIEYLEAQPPEPDPDRKREA